MTSRVEPRHVLLGKQWNAEEAPNDSRRTLRGAKRTRWKTSLLCHQTPVNPLPRELLARGHVLLCLARVYRLTVRPGPSSSGQCRGPRHLPEGGFPGKSTLQMDVQNIKHNYFCEEQKIKKKQLEPQRRRVTQIDMEKCKYNPQERTKRERERERENTKILISSQAIGTGTTLTATA
ncbi:hypothetical protein RUM43_006583 [Polyplax serrata]|uniref:Uncharacterized protein n=1 Tax=Polyplax serrata TaxID=468196 RepID=A0AAN8RVI2_POLSC